MRFLKKLFYYRTRNTKKYRLFGVTLLKIKKMNDRKVYKIFNFIKLSPTIRYHFSVKQSMYFYINRVIGKIVYRRQIKANRNARILVCLHMFYPQAWKLITRYLHNLDSYHYDLLITYTKGNFSDDEVSQMKQFKPGTTVIEYENKGFDVGPFIDSLNSIDLTKYDIVLKLHSKGITRKFIFIYNQIFRYKDWFFNLYNGVLGGKSVHIMIDELFNEPKIGIVAARNLIVHDPKHKRFFTTEQFKNTNIEILPGYQYVAGTCFAIKASLLQKFKKHAFTINNFAMSERGSFSFAHAMERVICAFIEPLGYEFYGIKTKHPLYKKETSCCRKYSSLRLLNDNRFKLDYDFFYKVLETRPVFDYAIKTIKLGNIRRYWDGNFYKLSDTSPYAYLMGNKERYDHYCCINSKSSPFNMSRERFDELIESIKKSYDVSKMPVINDKDSAIMDGQHRVAILLYLYGEEYEIPVLSLCMNNEKQNKIQIFQKIKINKKGRKVKKYKLCGFTVLRKEKTLTKKKWEFLGIKISKKLKRKAYITVNPKLEIKKYYKNIKDNIISIETIKKIISQSEIKVVSFDIFDTLLIRPGLYPTDVLYLVDAKIKKEYQIDFIQYRLSAEQKLGNPHATIDDIYDFIMVEYNLPSDVVNIMKKEELNCEASLLSRREDIYSLYEYAIKFGKRIIAISDMYLPAPFLYQVLEKNGYDKIAKIYVSNDCKCRKDLGELYRYVEEREKIEPQSILHIGDNYSSDYLRAIENNFTAIHYPSIKDIIFAQNSIYQNVWQKMSPDPMMRVLLGYTLNNYFRNMENVKNTPNVLVDFKALVELSISPVVMFIALSIANKKEIQNSYSKIFFASRDGYLPKLAYDIIKRYQKILPSEYLYAGRRAYFSCVEESIWNYMGNMCTDNMHIYKIENLLEGLISDKKIKHKIVASLSEDEKQLDFNRNRKQVIEILRCHKKVFDNYFDQHKANAKKYYNKLKTDSIREIVFDCGYSGSISKALTAVMEKPVDKIYLWEREKNKVLDSQNKTSTFVLMNEKFLFNGIHLLYEELFSPLEGGCLGFDENAQPLLEKCEFSESMKNKYDLIKARVASYVMQFCEIFKDYLPYISFYDTNALQRILYYSIKKSPYQEINNLCDIVFSDPIFSAQSQTLVHKIQEKTVYDDVYQGTGFNNPFNIANLPMTLPSKIFKIGIHCHLYNIHLYEEILDYLKDFPVKFDFILTICDEKKKNLLKNVFNEVTIPNLNNLIIKVVLNRGRDVAPWLISCFDEQKKYDLFCHIHGKISKHFSWGNEWRQYLFENLLQKGTVIDILNLFANDEKLGMIFPESFPALVNICINNSISKEGLDGEPGMIKNLLQKMHLNSDFTHKDLFFSEGTMMWYRPQALKPLFDLRLQYEDFPSEPIGIGGTIAHAIERLPAYVCQQCGYTAKFYTKIKKY